MDMDVSDEQLVARCKQELPYDTRAFEVLLRRYERVVFQTCRRYLNHQQEAEEASQDSFLRAFHGLPKFAGQSTFKTWLFRIVANVCATRYAAMAKAGQRQQALRESSPADVGTVLAPSDELAGPVGDALESLAEDDRKVLLLRHVSDLSLKEVAEALEISLSAAKMRLYRAEERLREVYKKT
ncbi:MAG: sigma-70 family RNA polymerase sigma factor [Planctomycetota bacterium]|nr:sigma-70 family RNA polymerase sigma factor [Planctomycetota bacterium]